MDGDFKRSLISALLILVVLISLVIIAAPVFATKADPPDNYVSVPQGEVFLLRGSITFDQLDIGEFSWGPVGWYHYGDPTENFCLENTPSVYWSDGTPVENVSISEEETANSHLIDIKDNGDGIERNGTFYIDIWLRAASGDGTPHKVDNQWIYFAMDMILLFEPGPVFVSAPPIYVDVTEKPSRGVEVSISPDNQSGVPCTTLDYTVTVKNTGKMGDDNYDLTVTDTENWGPTLDNYRFENIPEYGIRETTLHLHIPENAIGCENTIITVTATSQGDNTKSDNASCIAHVKALGVDVSISPGENGGLPGEKVTFAVTVTNTGGLDDNYKLDAVPKDPDWTSSVEPENLTLSAGENSENVTLMVFIPPEADNNDNTVVTVTATSQVDITVSDNDNCTAIAWILPAVSVEITPSEKSYGPGENVTFTVTVTNTGNVTDNYTLVEVSDNENWTPKLSENQFKNVPPGGSEQTTLTVSIPPTAKKGDNATITVTATAQAYPVWGSDSCKAYAGVFLARLHLYSFEENGDPSVAAQGCVDWSEGSVGAWPGPAPITGILDLKTISSEGWYSWDVSTFVEDKYYGDDKKVSLCMRQPTPVNWAYTYFYSKETDPENSPYLEVTYPLNIPPYVLHPTDDADLENDDTERWSADNFVVENDDNQQINSYLKFELPLPLFWGASVEVTPSEGYGLPGDNIYFTVEVTNEGYVEDDYTLEVSNTENWSLELSENQFNNVPYPGGSRETTLTVSIPPTAEVGDNTTITVTVTPQECGGFIREVSCIAYAGFIKVEVSISPENLTIPIEVSEDSYVDDKYPDNNYGNDNHLICDNRVSYLKWKLPSIQSDLLSAKINMYCTDNEQAGTVEACRVENDDWLEDEITWNNRPDLGSIENSTYVDNENRWYSWDVTYWVNDQLKVDDIVSVALRTESGAHLEFYSREGSENKPYLEIIYEYKDNLRGGMLSYTVTVTNLGNVRDTYTLENSDTENWALELGDNMLTISAGENETTTLTIMIPKNAENCTWDNITVTATSQENENERDNASCRAHTISPKVRVSISPPSQDSPLGATLSYTVTVTNLVIVSQDNYTLDVSDNENWALEIDNEVTIPANSSDNVTLTVTIPENAAPCTKDNITVTATSQTDDNARDNASCRAHALSLSRGVEVLISPENQDNLPGVVLSYEVTVANTGNITDTYELEAKDNMGWTIAAPIDPVIVREDSYVDYDNPDNNYGNDTHLKVERLSATRKLYTYLKWQLPPTLGDLFSAKINMYCTEASTPGTVKACRVENDNWLENEITWNNQPVLGSIESSTYVDSKDRWYSWDVTSWVKNQLEVDGIVSVALKATAVGENLEFYSSEGSEEPYLEIFHFGENLPPISLGSLTVPGNENRKVMLGVMIPENAENCTWDNITVTATSQENENVTDNASCRAHAAFGLTVKVMISPPENGAENGQVSFTVTVKNAGSVEDNYELAVGDNDWVVELDDNSFQIAPGKIQTTTLTVTIPDNAALGTWDDITVTASSPEPDGGFPLGWTRSCRLALVNPSDNTIQDFRFDFEFDRPVGMLENCADLRIYRGPTELPFYLESRGAIVRGWAHYLPSENIGPFGSDDNLWVYWGNPTAENVENKGNVENAEKPPTISTLATDSQSFIGRCAIPRGLKVSISPPENNAPAGETPNYTVTVQNIGMESETFDLTAEDDLGWGPTLEDNLLEVPAGENRQTKLSVTIPWRAENCTQDDITVTATAVDNKILTDNASCTAHALAERSVEVSISPDNQGNLSGGKLYYEVTVANTGTGSDNYRLTAGDHQGWTLALEDNTLMVGSDSDKTTKLTVTIPENAENCTEDNITVTATSQADNTVSAENSCIAHAIVSRGVEVSISPKNKDGKQEEKIQYTVTVVNKGVRDSYDLTVIDNENWVLELVPNLLKIPLLENRTTALIVTIPENEPFLTQDNITVTATSQENENVRDNDSCVARVVSADYHVKVWISPSGASAAPGDNDVTFTVTVRNRGTEWDAYRFDKGITGNPPGWTLKILPRGIDWLFEGGEGTATLTVSIPDNVEPGTIENIWVKAISAHFESVYNVGKCTVYVPSVSVSIEPPEDNAAPGENATFTVTVTNLSEEFSENYALTVSDNLVWGPVLEDNFLEVPAGENQTTKLSVHIPENAIGCTRDNITVTVISQADDAVRDNASCIAHAVAVRGVEVSISPPSRSAAPGQDITFTVTIKNTGDVSDTYTLETADDAGWSLSLDNTSLTVPENENRTATLTVTIPDNASPGTEDSITVTATSQADNRVENSASCTVRAIVARGVEVSISPDENEGAPGDTVTFTVTVTNTGISDTYDLTVSDDAGWAPTLSDNLLTISAGENETTTVSVIVPSDAIEGETTMITVTATSQADPTVENSATCTAKAGEKPPSPGLPVVPLAVGGVAIGGGVAIAVLLKKRIISLPFLRLCPFKPR